MTKESTAKWIIDYFQPTGLVLEPCRGTGVFYNNFPGEKDWCEITDGKDFFDYDKKVDWIITNPPFSIFDKFLLHAFKIADNVVFFCPLSKSFKSKRMDMAIREYGDIATIINMGGGGRHGFPFGFATGCIHYKRDYTGPITYERNYDDVDIPTLL